MAIGWLTVLKSVPWTEVIGNAPIVVDGAKKLWNAVSKPSAVRRGAGGEAAQAQDAAQPHALHALESRIGTLEGALADLQAQMLQSSELIKALADQNAQLIGRIEALRRLMLGLGLGTLVALGVAAWSAWAQLAR